jgi:hypothetical protein
LQAARNRSWVDSLFVKNERPGLKDVLSRMPFG